MSHILVVTGSRDANSAECQNVIAAFVKDHPVLEVWHGDHPSGADMAAHSWGRRNGYYTVAWPADWKSFGRKAGPIRNKTMLTAALHDPSGVYVLALPSRSAANKGTLGAVKEALALRMDVAVRWVD